MPIDFNVQVNDLVLGTVVQMYATDAQFAISNYPTRYSLAGTKTPPLTAAASLLEAQTTSSVNWQNFGFETMVPGTMILKLASSFVARLQFTAGSPIIGSCSIKRTLNRSLPVVDTTLVTFNNGAAYPLTLTTPKTVFTDPIPVALDNDHDYWFTIFFTNVSANASVGVIQDAASTGRNLSVIGSAGQDFATATTMTALGNQATLLLLGFYA